MSFDLTKRHLKIDLQRANITDTSEDANTTNKLANKPQPKAASKPSSHARTPKRYNNPYMASVENRKGNAKEVARQLHKARDTLALTNDFVLMQSHHSSAKKTNHTTLNLGLLTRKSTTKDKVEHNVKRFANKIRYTEDNKEKKHKKTQDKLKHQHEL